MELKQKNVHVLDIENVHKSLSSKRRKNSFFLDNHEGVYPKSIG